MKHQFTCYTLILTIFFSNPTLGANFYFNTSTLPKKNSIYLGDLNFTYSLSKFPTDSKEVFEQGPSKITIKRSKKESLMWVEQKTLYGILTLKYRNNSTSWTNIGFAFREYTTHYKGKKIGSSTDTICSPPPSEKNINDIALYGEALKKDNFGPLFFEKDCAEKLSPPDYEKLVDSLESILAKDRKLLDSLGQPKSLSCVKDFFAESSSIYDSFESLRNRVALHKGKPSSPESVKSDPLIPLPISCDLNGKKIKKCGSTTEGKKTKIHLDVNCLKQGNESIEVNAREIFMHEFAHTVSEPHALKEVQVQGIDKGNCAVNTDVSLNTGKMGDFDVTMTNSVATGNTKDEIGKKINSEQTGAKTIAGDVVNPYAGFADSSTQSPTNIASATNRETSTNYSGSQNTTASQRMIASTGSIVSATNSSSNLAVDATIPTLSQQAQYTNTKAYVNAAVGTISKKIAPIVSYVESPAFAATLPSSTKGSVDTETTASLKPATTSSDSAAIAKSASISRSNGSSNEVASSSTGGGSVNPSNSSPANLGTSTSATGTSRLPAAVKNNSRKSDSDTNLDNVYALKVRKRLVTDAAFGEDLRKKGVRIKFADGYRFETNGATIQYTEKNGVLVRGN